MKFIVKRASQYNYLGDEEFTEPCKGGKWQKVIYYDRRVCSAEEANKIYKGDGNSFIPNENGDGCYRIFNHPKMYVMSFRSIKELMNFVQEQRTSIIIDEQDHYNLPEITIYDDYIE